MENHQNLIFSRAGATNKGGGANKVKFRRRFCAFLGLPRSIQSRRINYRFPGKFHICISEQEAHRLTMFHYDGVFTICLLNLIFMQFHVVRILSVLSFHVGGKIYSYVRKIYTVKFREIINTRIIRLLTVSDYFSTVFLVVEFSI